MPDAFGDRAVFSVVLPSPTGSSWPTPRNTWTTALVCAGFVDVLEERHDKPVVAVNSATYWLALREHGIDDRIDDHGVLLARH